MSEHALVNTKQSIPASLLIETQKLGPALLDQVVLSYLHANGRKNSVSAEQLYFDARWVQACVVDAGKPKKHTCCTCAHQTADTDEETRLSHATDILLHKSCNFKIKELKTANKALKIENVCLKNRASDSETQLLQLNQLVQQLDSKLLSLELNNAMLSQRLVFVDKKLEAHIATAFEQTMVIEELEQTLITVRSKYEAQINRIKLQHAVSTKQVHLLHRSVCEKPQKDEFCTLALKTATKTNEKQYFRRSDSIFTDLIAELLRDLRRVAQESGDVMVVQLYKKYERALLADKVN